MIIDVHAHHFPAGYMPFLGGAGILSTATPRRVEPRFAPTLPAPALQLAPEDLEKRFAAMKDAGVLVLVVYLLPKKRKVDVEVPKGAAQVVKWRVWRHN